MFQEAEVTDATKKQDEISITTDDLVLWLGEKLVETKHQAKILTLQKNKIVELESLYLKIQSQEASSALLVTETKALNEKLIADLKLQLKIDLEVLQARIKELEEQISKLQSLRHEYTISFETKVHEVALERDECRKELSALKAEIDILKQENEILSSLQKKKGVKKWLTHSK